MPLARAVILRLSMLAGLALFSCGRVAADPCPARGALLLVDTARRRLWTCADGRAAGEYAVALGSGGVGKSRHGDAKVPVGEYALGRPRPSPRFHTFIPVGYPTAEQRRRGYTGSDVGVHGPARGWEKLPASINTSTDWTLGCLALGSDAQIDEIAAWVDRKGASKIVIR
jgi:L,D-transpeptidase-like protein